MRKRKVTVSMNNKEYILQEGDTFAVTLDIRVEQIPGQTGKVTGDLKAYQYIKVVSVK